MYPIFHNVYIIVFFGNFEIDYQGAKSLMANGRWAEQEFFLLSNHIKVTFQI